MSHFFKIIILVLFSFKLFATETILVTDEYKRMAESAIQADISPDMLKRVGKIMQTIESESYRESMHDVQSMAVESLGLENNPYMRKHKSTNNLRQGDVMYVFVSKSVPLETLRNYAADISRFGNGIMVLRGFIDGATKAQPTAKFVHDVLQKDDGCKDSECDVYNIEVQIDPVLYQRYSVSEVPAIVFERDAQFDGYCGLKKSDIKRVNETATVIYGDVSLLEASKYLYKQNKIDGLERIIHSLTPKI